MTQKEFIDSTNRFFQSHNFIRKGRKFAFELNDMFVVFVLLKSYYCDCYYIDYNISLKELHKEFDFSDKCFDIILRPRLTLADGKVQLKPEEMENDEYINALQPTVTKLLDKISADGVKFLKRLQKQGFVIEKEAMEAIAKK